MSVTRIVRTTHGLDARELTQGEAFHPTPLEDIAVSQTPPSNPFIPPPPPFTGNPMYPADMLAQKAAVAASEAKNALIFAILGIFCFGFIFGFLAYRKANEALEIIQIYDVAHEKRGMATAAKVLGIVDICLWIVGLILRFTVR